MTEPDRIDADFWRVFGRAMGQALPPGHYQASQLSTWDSLRHVELVFELEEQFRIQIPPEQIAALYSDTDTVLAFLRTAVSAKP